MVRSIDGTVRHLKTFKAKFTFLFSENQYSQLRFFRKTIQTSVIPKKFREFIFV